MKNIVEIDNDIYYTNCKIPIQTTLYSRLHKNKAKSDKFYSVPVVSDFLELQNKNYECLKIKGYM
jgi:hypothetical protein